jgi:hypothetical protein
MPAYVRAHEAHGVTPDKPAAFRRTLADERAFLAARAAIWARREEYVPALAASMAALHRAGLSLFPSHFEFQGRAYTLLEPAALQRARAAEKKQAAFHKGMLAQLVADGRQDRLALLALGLATAQKVPHWTGYGGDDGGSAWSETDDED